MHDLKHLQRPTMPTANARPPEWACGLACLVLGITSGAVFAIMLTGGF